MGALAKSSHLQEIRGLNLKGLVGASLIQGQEVGLVTIINLLEQLVQMKLEEELAPQMVVGA